MTRTETLLRETLRSRAEEMGPQPDLGARVVERHRVRRRQRLLTMAAACIVAVVAVGVAVPLIRDRDGVADVGPVWSYPTRGSLADDESFLADVLRVPWPTPDDDLNPPLATRVVVFAGDVPGARWAYVVGRFDGQWTGAWLTGPVGADASALTMAAFGTPYDTSDALVVQVDPSLPETPLVVLGRPGDTFELSLRPEIDAEGRLSRDYEPLPAEDGFVVAGLPGAGQWSAVRVSRGGQVVLETRVGGLSESGFWSEADVTAAMVGAEGQPDAELVRGALMSLTDGTGLRPAEVAAARVLWGDAAPTGGVLVAARVPSGAVAIMGVCGDPSVSATVLLQLFPAGTDADDLLLVMACPDFETAEQAGLGEIDGLVVLAPPGTDRVRFRDGADQTTVEGDRPVVLQGDGLAGYRSFQALGSDGTVLATAEIGTIVDLGP